MSKNIETIELDDWVLLVKDDDRYYVIYLEHCPECKAVGKVNEVERLDEEDLFYILYSHTDIYDFMAKHNIKFSQKTAYNVIKKYIWTEFPRELRKTLINIFGELEPEIERMIDEQDKALVQKYGEDYDSAEK